MKNLIIANCVALLATELLPFGDAIIQRFALFNVASPLFHSYQVFTYMFLHGGLSHLFFNMFALWMFGRQLEYELGSQRFLIYYMVCGIGAALLQLGVGYAEWVHAVDVNGIYGAVNLLRIPTVGASGAVFGLLLAFGVLQIGMSLKSHDPSQRANGMLTLAGGIVITFTKEILTLITG